MYKYVDSETKIANIKAQYEMGLLTVNESREMMNLAPIEGGDRRVQSLNFMNTQYIDEYQMKKAEEVQKTVVDESKIIDELPSKGGDNNE